MASVALAFGACETSRGPANPDAVSGVGLKATARLDFEDAPTLPDEGGLLASDRTMELLAFVDRRVPYEVLVFSGDGSMMDRLGESGAGPGEYDRIRAVAFDDSGHLWIISREGTRADVYSPSLELDRSFTLDRPVRRAVSLGDVGLLFVTDGPSGPAVAILRQDGSLESWDLPWVEASDTELVAIATDGERQFWVTVPREFRVFQGSVDGALVEMDLKEPEWFADRYPASFQEEFGAMLDASGATILALEYDDSSELLWVTAGVPSPDVDAAGVRAAFESGDAEALAELPAMLIDHVVVGIDARTGRPVAEERFAYRPVSLASGLQYDIRDHTILEVVQPKVLR